MAEQGESDSAALFRRAVRLHESGQLGAASDAYQALLESAAHRADAASNLSAVCLMRGDVAGSERYARLALATRNDHANAWNHLGLACKARGAAPEAAAAFARAIALEPRHAMAWYNLGELRAAQDDMAGAVEAYAHCLAVEPDNAAALVGFIHRKQQIARWDGLDAALARLSRRIKAGDVVDPFALIFCCTDPAELLAAARNNAAVRERAVAALGRPSFPLIPRPDGRIRIGYVSANFYDHAVGSLICELLESHDRSRFTVYCYCHSAVKTGARRERIKRAADHFIEIDHMDDLAAARRIHDDGIDILVDLMGYTKGQRLRIFALRPAPVSATWIGFAGTIGGGIDYIIADKIVIPPGAERFYTEAVVHMPVSYQVNDATREVSARPVTRSTYGLPEEAVVYSCFNQTAKINPPMIDLWARILRQVPGSVLWLWRLYRGAEENLRAALQAAGVERSRAYFGESLPRPEHVARYGLCDLFLDTTPCGGHATASDALFGGCPVLALPGATFPSRVSASLLTALGLESLIASSPQDYVAKAVRIGTDAGLRRELKQRLIAARTTSPLFDGARFARDLERAFAIMVERSAAGEPPAAIDLA